VTLWDKIDPGLGALYARWLQEGGQEGGPRRIGVSLHATASADELAERGFETTFQEDEDRLAGTIDLADLERLAEHDGVRRIIYGRKGKPLLDQSIPDIAANAVWSRTGSTFSGQTGAGALIGIIDTGIDWRHPFFLGARTPLLTTRILRIWDMGLRPTGAEVSPTIIGRDYGVEYRDTHINEQLRRTSSAMPVRHRDCGGHGTHVASIAAGDGGPGFTHIGVAPRAELIVVKLLDLDQDPELPPGTAVDPGRQFKDAVLYIEAVASALGKPVAINVSLGSNLGPHDGFTDEEDWIRHHFDGKTGAILVISSGNDGGNRQHARIEFSAAGSVSVPIELRDPRTNRRERDRCRWENATHELLLDVWYPAGGATLAATIDIPWDGTGPHSAPAAGTAPVTGTALRRDWFIQHGLEAETLRGGAGVVRRNILEFGIEPHRNRHILGDYTLQLTSSGALTAHLWCGQNRGHEFKIKPSPPANVHVEDRNLIGPSAGAANAITVAAYDAEASGDPIVSFSSHGPLVRYQAGPPNPAVKPDLCAPGHHVDAAKSRDSHPPMPGNTVSFSGTSMSAPHVTGVVALMFAKRQAAAQPSLTVTQVRDLLRTNVRAASPVVPEEGGAGRLHAQNAVNAA
jgi:subtilisin family serine protease